MIRIIDQYSRCFFLMLAILYASNLSSQSSMLVHKKEGTVVAYAVDIIDSITFADTIALDRDAYYIASIDSLKKRVTVLEEIIEAPKFHPPTYSYDNVMRTIQRIGYGMPEQSIVSYKRALNAGFRILLCDLVFTKDNVPCCFHDIYLNQNRHYVRYADGSELPDAHIEDNRVYIRDCTYQELCNQYDFGVYAGIEYAGTKILKLEEMLSFAKNAGIELYVEVKEMDEKLAKRACRLIQKYGMTDKTSWSGDTNQMRYVINTIPTARVSIMPRQITSKDLDSLISLKTGNNKVFFFAWNETILDDEIVDKLIENEIEFEMGTIDTTDDLNNYFSRSEAYKYCTGVESNTLLVGKVLYEQNQ